MKLRYPSALRRRLVALGGVSVRTKVMGIVLSLVLFLGLVETYQVHAAMRQTVEHCLQVRGAAMAEEVAARSTGLVLSGDLSALRGVLLDSVAYHHEMRYAFVLDPDGRLLVHSFDGGLPADLLAANAVSAGERHHLEILDTDNGPIWDFAVPILKGRAGTVRLGLTEQPMQDRVTSTTRRLLSSIALTSLGGAAGAYLLACILTSQVRALVSATEAVGRGQLDVEAPSLFDDEIGRLGAAFNQMVNDLARVRRQRDEHNRLLVRRNRALAALNAVARAVSGPLTLEEVLARALEKVLDLTGHQFGWTCLLDDEGRCSRVSACPELRAGSACGKAELCLARWTGGRVLEDPHPEVIPIPVTCPLAEECGAGGLCPSHHVAVPLVTRSKVLGVLSVATDDPVLFDAAELELLGAIGHQLGVAIENARLWEEVWSKEAMRGQLLEKVISAQEEERKRIARELHDETSQSLASLLVGLKALEAAEGPSDGLQDLKAIASGVLDAVHNLAVELRPSMLDDLGLVAAVQRFTKDHAVRFNVATDFQTVGLDGHRLAPEVEIALYRIIQEAMTNAARHAAAGQTSVLLERRGDSVVAIVEDDGQGFDVEEILGAEIRHRLGLCGMEERAVSVGGLMTFESSPEAGTTVFVEVPL